jgi:hypothetical protein
MKVKRGGLKLKNINKKGFKALFDMINSASAKINLLTYSSLKGFMIELSVSEQASEYFSLKGNMFVEPVTNYILKFAVITKDNDTLLPQYYGREKASESRESFFDEAKLQQKIWTKSILGGRPQICPPVANFSIFDTQNSLKLLSFLSKKTTDQTQDIFNYLHQIINVNDSYEIGVLTMPKVNNSNTLGSIIYSSGINIEIINKTIANVIAQIVRLFIELGVIHFDLHTGNVLVYDNGSGQPNSLIIDFGRASDIENGLNDDYLSASDKIAVLDVKKSYYDEFLSKLSRIDEPGKIKFMKDVLTYIAHQDLTINKKLFGYSDNDRFQMDWLKNVLVDPSLSNILLDSYYILKTMALTEGNKILPMTIKKYENMGYILKFDDINNYLVEFPDIAAPLCDKEMAELGICTIMGGRKHKKTIKQKTSKKYRKSIKHRK